MTDDVLIAFLLSFPGVSSLIGARAFPYGVLPQKRTGGELSGDLPSITVNNLSEESHHSSNQETGRPETDCYTPMRFQIDIYAATGAEVARVDRAIRAVLDGFQGTMGATLIGGVWRRFVGPIERMPETLLFHRNVDFLIHVMG